MWRCLWLSLALMSVGLCAPEMAYGNGLAVSDRDNQVGAVPSHPAAALAIEELLEPDGDGRLSYDRSFDGDAGEIIVFDLKKEDGFPFSLDTAVLYSPNGEEIYPDYHSDFTGFDYFGEPYLTFTLPETGEYSFAVEVDHAWGDAEAAYLLQLRAANNYERLLIVAENKVDLAQYEEAFPLLARAVDCSPELPAAYISRLLAYTRMVATSSAFEERVQALRASQNTTDDILGAIYETFKALEEEEQAMVLADLRQVEQLYTDAIEQDGLEMRDEFELVLYGAIADFFESGVPSDPVRLLING